MWCLSNTLSAILIALYCNKKFCWQTEMNRPEMSQFTCHSCFILYIKCDVKAIHSLLFVFSSDIPLASWNDWSQIYINSHNIRLDLWIISFLQISILTQSNNIKYKFKIVALTIPGKGNEYFQRCFYYQFGICAKFLLNAKLLYEVVGGAKIK